MNSQSEQNVRQTSIIAYHQEIENKHIGKQHKLVLWYIRKFPDRTDRELTKLMGYVDPNKVRPRRRELEQAGLIYESGRRKCRVTGKLACIWREKRE